MKAVVGEYAERSRFFRCRIQYLTNRDCLRPRFQAEWFATTFKNEDTWRKASGHCDAE